MSDSKEYTVQELIDEKILAKPLDGNHGGTHPKGNDFIESGIPFVMASDIKNGIIDLTTCKFISKEQADKLRKGFAKEGDVLLTHKATIGRTAIVKEIDSDYIMLTPQVTYYRVLDVEKLDRGFLYAYFNSKPFQSTLNLWAGGGSTRAYLGITGQLKLPIILPPLQEQKRIAHILGTLDDKIELNRKMNQTLESMAQALFQSWFVDFDPVLDNALAAGNPIPEPLQKKVAKRNQAEASTKLINTNPVLAKLFPSTFVFNETLNKWIPDGWEVKKVQEIAKINNSSWTKKNKPEDVKYVDLASAKSGSIVESSFYNYDDAPSRAKRILNIDDTIFGTVRPGNRSFAYILENGLTGSTGFAVFTPLKDEYRTPVYLYLT
jgi:type I restriction enzyme S subunit